MGVSSLCCAKELAGVTIEEVVTVSPGGEPLRLKGAAIKSNARQAIYVGGLYLQDEAQKAKTVEDIVSSEGAKRFVLYCQNSTIKPEALIRALNLGITANHTEEELNELEPMVKQFNQIWSEEIHQGDKVWIDFLPGEGTQISINGEAKGLIPGKTFYDAFLKTWLGSKPLNASMKKQILGS
nr:chalcone isomerase family protein [Aliikangiella sp. G2MR2-5]